MFVSLADESSGCRILEIISVSGLEKILSD